MFFCVPIIRSLFFLEIRNVESGLCDSYATATSWQNIDENIFFKAQNCLKDSKSLHLNKRAPSLL